MDKRIESIYTRAGFTEKELPLLNARLIRQESRLELLFWEKEPLQEPGRSLLEAGFKELLPEFALSFAYAQQQEIPLLPGNTEAIRLHLSVRPQCAGDQVAAGKAAGYLIWFIFRISASETVMISVFCLV